MTIHSNFFKQAANILLEISCVEDFIFLFFKKKNEFLTYFAVTQITFILIYLYRYRMLFKMLQNVTYMIITN